MNTGIVQCNSCKSNMQRSLLHTCLIHNFHQKSSPGQLLLQPFLVNPLSTRVSSPTAPSWSSRARTQDASMVWNGTRHRSDVRVTGRDKSRPQTATPYGRRRSGTVASNSWSRRKTSFPGRSL